MVLCVWRVVCFLNLFVVFCFVLLGRDGGEVVISFVCT